MFSVTEDEAKDVHRSMKIAAGIFKHLKVKTYFFQKSCIFFDFNARLKRHFKAGTEA